MNEIFNSSTPFNGQIDSILFSILKYADAIISILDAEGRYLYVNHQVAGHKKEEIIGQSVFDYLPENLSQQLRNNLLKVINSGKSTTYQNEFTEQGGISRYYTHVMSPVKTNDRDVQAVILITTEITEAIPAKENAQPQNSIIPKKECREEEAFIKNEEKLAVMADATEKKKLILEKERREKVLHDLVNATSGKRSMEYFEALVMSLGSIVHADAASEEELRANLEELQATQKILEQKQMELKVALAHNVAITNALDNSALVSITDLKGIIIKANNIFCEVAGYAEDELLGQDHCILNSGFHSKTFWKAMWRMVGNGKTWRAEVCNRAKDGTLYWVDTVINPIRNEQGKIYQYLSIRYLITERKKAEKKLKNAYDLLEKSNEAARIGTWEVDLETMQITWSKVTKQIREVEDDFQANEENIITFYKEGENRETITRMITDCKEKGEKFDVELQTVTAKGNEKWVRVIGIPVMENRKCVQIYGLFQDIDERKKALLEIQKLSLVASKTHNGVVITDAKGRITWVNDAFTKITGFKQKEALGKKPGTFLHGADTNPEHIQHIRKALKSKKPFAQEILNYTKKGVPYWNKLSITPIFDDQGKVIQFIGIQNDITERKMSQIALQESEERIKSIANSVPGAVNVYKLNPDGTDELLFVSDQAERLFEVKKEELQANTDLFWELILEEDLQKMIDSVKKSIDELSFWNQEWRIQTKSGKIKWLNGRGMPHKHPDGSVVWNALMLDITDRKLAEESLFKAYNLLEKSNETARIGTWEVDLSLQHLTWSKVTRQIHEVEDDYQPDIENAIAFYKEGESRNTITSVFTACVEKGEKYDVELQIISTKGHEKWIRTIGIPIMEKGKCVRVYGVFQDIDEKTKTIKQLAFQEEQFRKTFENAPNGVALVDLEGNWFKLNKSFCDILGYAAEELLKLSFLDITHPEEKKYNRVLFKAMIAGKQESFQTEKRYIHKNGSIVWATLSVSAVKNDLGNIIHFVYQIIDITQEKLSQLQLQEHIKRLQGILDASTQVGIVETDAKGIIKIFNKGAENLFGYHAEEVVDKLTPEIFQKEEYLKRYIQALPEDFHESNETFDVAKKLLEKELFTTREWTFVRKNGATFPGLLSLTPVRNADNKLSGSLGMITDLTEIKRAESKIKSLLDVTQAQNKRLLNFAHIVSHNLRSHTANFSMILDLMQTENTISKNDYFFPLLKEASGNLKETIVHLNEVVVMNTTTQENLTNLNLFDYVEKSIADVKALAIEAKSMIHNKVQKNIKVQAVPAYLESIILNILTNAIKYRSQKRRSIIIFTTELKNDYVLLSVKDNGIGVDTKLHGAKLFGMYKTFHGNEDARGIGLFITKNQVEAMGGSIEVESEVNKGSTFKIYLLYEKV